MEMVSATILRKNKLIIAILLYLIIMVTIHYTKPSLVYMPDGSFRQFGVGYKNKTVIPIWVISIIVAILCYLAISYYLLFIYTF